MKADKVAKAMLLKGRCCYTCDHLSIDKRYCTVDWYTQRHLNTIELDHSCGHWIDLKSRNGDFEVPMTPQHNDIWVNESDNEFYVYQEPDKQQYNYADEKDSIKKPPYWTVHSMDD